MSKLFTVQLIPFNHCAKGSVGILFRTLPLRL